MTRNLEFSLGRLTSGNTKRVGALSATRRAMLHLQRVVRRGAAFAFRLLAGPF